MAYSGNKPSTMGKTSDKYRSDDKASTVRTGDRKKLSASSGSYTSEPDIGKRSDNTYGTGLSASSHPDSGGKAENTYGTGLYTASSRHDSGGKARNTYGTGVNISSASDLNSGKHTGMKADREPSGSTSGSTSKTPASVLSDTKAARRGTSSVTSVSQWFVTICCLGIPVIGAIYAICIALNSRGDRSKRHFAAAYIIFKILVWILVVVILYVIYKMGLNVLEIALDMMSGE
ncbi:MAG: hypothetical protein VZR23_08710 [Lachnospiraceae bacterium]|nr:hypothetical protein [Lachnospiraceae bacterium]